MNVDVDFGVGVGFNVDSDRNVGVDGDVVVDVGLVVDRDADHVFDVCVVGGIHIDVMFFVVGSVCVGVVLLAL